MEQLWERMEALERRCEQAERRCREAQAQHQEAERRWRQAVRRAQVQGGVAVAAVVGALLLSPGSRAALAQGYGATLGSLAQRVAALESESAEMHSQVTPLTNLFLASNPVDGKPFFSRRGTDISITGANLHLVNGLGATNGLPDSPDSINTDPSLGPVTQVNGLGNLIIGYNEMQRTGSGSHNLVVGMGQNFSSFGGLVAGQGNAISGPYASVSGGLDNEASAFAASVNGGHENSASANGASVSGGEANTASDLAASVSGGFGNTASAEGASVSGGEGNTASSFATSVSGGSNNTASAPSASVSGGGSFVLGAGITQSNPLGWSGGGSTGSFHSP